MRDKLSPIQGELAAQMAQIAQEVARVQIEMQKIKRDSFRDFSEQLDAIKLEASNIRVGEDQDFIEECDKAADERGCPTVDNSAAVAVSSPSPAIRRTSSYGIKGKLTPTKRWWRNYIMLDIFLTFFPSALQENIMVRWCG
jgi:hypothetical protein